MKRFFQNLSARMQQWMAGRYGYDELCRTTSIAALILILLACFQPLRFLYFPALILWGYSIFRSYSRNIEKRQAERASYLRFSGHIKSALSLKKKAWQERKTHKYFKCSHCKTVLRVPKGKGKIKISCPKCHTDVVKTT